MRKTKSTAEPKDSTLVRKTFVTEVVTDEAAKKLFDACKKTYNCKIKGAVVDEERTMFLKISTIDPDRSHDRVFPKGFMLDDFIENPVVAAFHDYHKPAVGRALQMGISDNYVISKMEFPPTGTNPEADILHGLYSKGFQHAASIGFIPDEMEPNDIGGYDFIKTNLLEYSLVLVPDNPKALQMMYEKGFNPDTYKEDFLDPEKAEEKSDEKQTKEAPKAEKTEDEKETKASEVTVKIGDTEEVIKTLDEGKALIDRLAAENEALKKEVATHKEADNPSTDLPISGLTVGQLKDLLADWKVGQNVDKSQKDVDNEAKKIEDAVIKDVDEVLVLSDVLSVLSWVIWCFEHPWDDEEEKVSQSSIDKLNQALGLVLQVVQEQAVLGEKSFKLADIPKGKENIKIVAKAGRTISGKHEDMLKSAVDYMTKGAEQVNTVLESVGIDNEPTEDNEKSIDGKSHEDAFEKLANAIATNNRKTDSVAKKQNETLSMLEIIAGEIGGEK